MAEAGIALFDCSGDPCVTTKIAVSAARIRRETDNRGRAELSVKVFHRRPEHLDSSREEALDAVRWVLAF
jgi:hypothetical protein